MYHALPDDGLAASLRPVSRIVASPSKSRWRSGVSGTEAQRLGFLSNQASSDGAGAKRASLSPHLPAWKVRSRLAQSCWRSGTVPGSEMRVLTQSSDRSASFSKTGTTRVFEESYLPPGISFLHPGETQRQSHEPKSQRHLLVQPFGLSRGCYRAPRNERRIPHRDAG